MTCNECKGKGQIELLTSAKPCEKCAGTGKLEVVGSISGIPIVIDHSRTVEQGEFRYMVHQTVAEGAAGRSFSRFYPSASFEALQQTIFVPDEP